MRVFLGTNVVASAFGSSGVCTDLFREVVENHDLLTSDQVLAELQEVLPRRFGATAREVREVLAILRSFHVETSRSQALEIELRDPDDLGILGAAIAAGADVLVTGDKDLLSVAARAPIRIVNPRGFIEMQ